MTLDQTVYEYYDIVPRSRELTWTEKNLPASLLGMARKHGYFLLPVEPAIVQQPFPDEFTVRIPSIPYDSKVHPLIKLCDMVEAFADRMEFGDCQYKNLTTLMDKHSFDSVMSVPFRGDDTMGGDAYFHSIALSQYVMGYFDRKKKYDITSVGTTHSDEGEGLVLKILRLPKA